MRHSFSRSPRLSRRRFLSGVATSAAAAILAACGGSNATTDTPNPTASATTGVAPTAAPAVTAAPVRTAVPAGSAPSGMATVAVGGSAPATVPLAVLPPPAADKFKGQTLTMLSRQEYFKDVDLAFDAALADFSKATSAKIENTHINLDTGDIVGKQDAAVKSGSVQDMAYFTGFIPQFQQLGDIVDVSDVVEELQKAYGPVEDEIKLRLVIDGKWWGIPYYSQAIGWFARKDWMDEKNIKFADIKTFENLRDAALMVSDPSKNRYGWGCTINRSGDANNMMLEVLQAYGGAIASDDGKKVTFNSPETLAAITFLADIYTNPKYKNMLAPGVLSWTDTGNNEAWLAGTLGFTQNGFTLYAQSKVQKNPVYEKTATTPGFLGPGTDRAIRAGSWGAFVIFKGAKNPDLAKAVAKYMVAGKPLADVVALSAGLIMPAYKKIWDSDPLYTNGDPIFPTIRAIVQQPLPIVTKSGFHFPQTPSPGNDQAVNTYILPDMMGEIVSKGVKVPDAIKSATDRIVQAFEQLGIKQ